LFTTLLSTLFWILSSNCLFTCRYHNLLSILRLFSFCPTAGIK
jgi:hypothetical protein